MNLIFHLLSNPKPSFRAKTIIPQLGRVINLIRPPMASDANPPPEMEDFVRIENAKAEDLTESIVRIENATAEDLTESIVRIENPTAEASTESIVAVDEPRETDSSAEGAESEPEPESESEAEPRPRFLPEELSRSVVVLECESSAIGGTCDVHIIGTAHVSSDSCREVEAIIRYLKPEVVFLELCPSRTSILLPQSLKVPTTREMIDMWKNNQNLFGILYSWFLAKVASQLEVFPGSEFRVGYEEAIKYGGRVILGDRPVQITLRRTWAKMPRWHKIKLIYSLFFQAVFLPSAEELNKMLKEMDDVDMITLVIQEMSKQFPTLMETLVHERDQYMSATLHGVASKNRSVVAVVGKGHLQGIQRHWKQPVMLMELLEVPKPANSKVRMFKALGVAAVGVAVMSGVYLFRKR